MTASWAVWGMAALAVLGLLLLSGCASPGRKAALAELRDDEWRSFDGKVMPFTDWGPDAASKPCAVVIAVHGLSGAASDFWLAGERLAARGWRLYALDLRGQGKDPDAAERGHIRRARWWRRDLETFDALVRARHPGAPVFWLGESLGSLIVLHTAARTGGATAEARRPAGLILSSPVAGLRQPLPGGKRWLLDAASLVAPRRKVRLEDLAGVDASEIQVTADTTHGSQMAVTPHHVPSFTVRLLAETGRWMEGVDNAARRARMPVLVLASPNDVVSAPEQIQRLFGALGTADKTLRWYERSHHLLLHDVQREEVAADLLKWLEEQSLRMERTQPACLWHGPACSFRRPRRKD